MIVQMYYFTDDDDIRHIIKLSHDELWDAGVNLDDWDYGILICGKIKRKQTKLFYLDNLLNGVFKNEWYEFKNKKGEWFTLGMAYHS